MADEAIKNWLYERWGDCFAQAVESMIGDRPQVQASQEPFQLPPGEDAIHWSERLSLGTDFTLDVSFPRSSWMAIANAALKAVGLEESDPESLRNTFREMLSQTLTQLVQEISGRLGQEIRCAGGQLSDQPAPTMRLELILPTGSLEHGVGFAEKLIDLLAAAPQTESGPAAEHLPAKGNRLGERNGAPPRTLDLLLDVELPVSVSFGRAQVPLKEVVKLNSGSIVELNRTVSEPVEVIVNNCVIARGEVVVVEGNYGIRIQEIVSRQERLRTLN